MRFSDLLRRRCAIAVSLTAAPFVASAAPITGGVFQMHNHPDGNAAPPTYGMRLDELYDATGGHDIFTFDFNHPQSNMQLVFDDVNMTIAIDGVAYGGRDGGGAYANDAHLGLYNIHFVYSVGVGQAMGDDDLIVMAPDGSNTGTILTPIGDTKVLADVGMDGKTFRLGDEDDDAGHRGFPGISGWGWMSVNGEHVANMDWLFTVTRVPEPASLTLVALSAIGLLRRRA